jgi:two-component system alkaline phosphatase synthesis response regulator PhoP
MMGPPDGLEVCRQLRANPDTTRLPVILLTALGEELDRIVGFETGADDYVAKPFSPARAGAESPGAAAPHRWDEP